MGRWLFARRRAARCARSVRVPLWRQVFYSVRVDDGRLLAGTPDFAPRASQAADTPDHYDTVLHGQPVRAVGIVRLMYDNGATRPVRITVGKTMRSRDA